MRILGASFVVYPALLRELLGLERKNSYVLIYRFRLHTDVDIAGVHSKFMMTLLRDPQPDNTSIILLMVVCLFAGDRPHLTAPAKDFIDNWQLR